MSPLGLLHVTLPCSMATGSPTRPFAQPKFKDGLYGLRAYRKVAQVREALEQTKAHGIRFKPPKSKAGRRDITLPDILVGARCELDAFGRHEIEKRVVPRRHRAVHRIHHALVLLRPGDRRIRTVKTAARS